MTNTPPTPPGRLSRAAFLRTPVRDLARILDDGTVWVADRPAGMSQREYRQHLDSGDRMTVRIRPTSTADLPPSQWGGAEYVNLDPVSARTIAATDQARPDLTVTVTWQTS